MSVSGCIYNKEILGTGTHMVFPKLVLPPQAQSISDDFIVTAISLLEIEREGVDRLNKVQSADIIT